MRLDTPVRVPVRTGSAEVPQQFVPHEHRRISGGV
jgi:hypothetical protein